jgi:hypothetical protein
MSFVKEDRMRPKNILITGIGLSGKSTLRRQLVDFLTNLGVNFVQHDADGFAEVRDIRDARNVLSADEIQLALTRRETVVLVEDVHGAELEGNLRPLVAYDLVLYVEPTRWAYFFFWLSRAWQWFRRGHYAWDREAGWSGSGKPYQLRNLLHIGYHMIRALWHRKRWVAQDHWVMRNSGCMVWVLRSYWTRRGPGFLFKF